MRDFKRLDVWQRSRRLTVLSFDLAERMPRAERFGVAAQLTRAANSVGANIAEGAGRSTRLDYARFLGYALGSCNEVEHHLIIAQDADLLPTDSIDLALRHVSEIRRMLVALRNRVLAPGQPTNL